MTSDYRIILPLMVTVVFSALFARKIFPHSIYTAKLIRRGIDIRSGKDVNVLRSHKVAEIMDESFEKIRLSTTLQEILLRVERGNDSYFVVVNQDDAIQGVISFQDLRSLLSQHSLDNLVIAKDLVHEETCVVNYDDDLEQAFKLFGIKDLKMIPVINKYDNDKVIGVLRREDLIDYYNKQLIETLRR